MYEGSPYYNPTRLDPLIDHQEDTSIEKPSKYYHLMNIETDNHNKSIHDLNWHKQIQVENYNTCMPNMSLITPNPTPHDLLNCLNSSISFSNPTNMDQMSHDTFSSEKHRRQLMNDYYDALRNLIPNPTKGPDRASVVKDAIIYINELKRTVEELKIILERKRCNKERMKKHKGGGANRQWYNGTLKYMCYVLIVLMLFRIFILYIC